MDSIALAVVTVVNLPAELVLEAREVIVSHTQMAEVQHHRNLQGHGHTSPFFSYTPPVSPSIHTHLSRKFWGTPEEEKKLACKNPEEGTGNVEQFS